MLQNEADGNNCDESFKNFACSCNVILNKHALQEKKGLEEETNQLSSIRNGQRQLFKDLKIFLENKTEDNINNCVKKRNLCVTLFRKSKITFFGSLNEEYLCNNKKSWGVVKPLLSRKVVFNEKLTLLDDDNIVENDKNPAALIP